MFVLSKIVALQQMSPTLAVLAGSELAIEKIDAILSELQACERKRNEAQEIKSLLADLLISDTTHIF